MRRLGVGEAMLHKVLGAQKCYVTPLTLSPNTSLPVQTSRQTMCYIMVLHGTFKVPRGRQTQEPSL